MSDKIPLQIPAYLNKYSSIASGLKLEFITQELIAPELLTSIISLKDKLGYLFFGVKQIEAIDLKDLPKIDFEKYLDGKTPSQRLRNVIYLLWVQEGSKGTQEDYYKNTMEKIINWMKDKLT